MKIDFLGFLEGDSYISPGTIGGKIRKYREMHGWTQKELGLKCGFSPNSADVRIAQYEKNRKVPREKVLKDIASALEIDETALFDADLLVQDRMFHALFDIEDFHGLHPVKIGRDYYLEFSGSSLLKPKGLSKLDYDDFLEKWYEMRQRYLIADDDTNEEKERKIKEYALWRGDYPHNVAVETSSRIHDQMRMRHLQAEMDALNAKMKNEEELNRIDESLKDMLDDVRSSCKPVKMESDLILLIKKLIENGIGVEIYSPEDTLEPNYEITHLLSVKTEEILNDEERKRLFAELVCGLGDIQQCGIDLSRKITSLKNVLYVTYSYPSSQYMYFQNIHRFWDDMIFITERKNHWPDFQLNEYEEKFLADITGKNDVAFSERLDEG